MDIRTTIGPGEAERTLAGTDRIEETQKEISDSSVVIWRRRRTGYSPDVIPLSRKRQERAKTGTDVGSLPEGMESMLDQRVFVTSRAAPVRRPSVQFLEVIRAHVVGPILDALEQVQPHAGSPGATVYVNQILHRIRQLEDQSPEDPLLRVLFALYDALAFDGRWADYSADQYRAARDILLWYSGRPLLQPRDVGHAIRKLEELGFDTMPFPLDEPTET